MPTDRPLPADPAAETAVVASLLIYGDAVPRVSGWLRPNHFHNQEAAKLYAAILALADDNEPIDELTVSDYLISNGMDRTDARRLVGAWGIGNGLPDIANLAAHARIVKRDADRRSAIRQCEKSLEDFWNNSNVTTSAGSMMNAAIELIDTSTVHKSTVPIGDSVIEVISRLDDIVSVGATAIDGIPSGYYSIDDLLGGWPKGVMSMFCAPPSMGKTALTLNFALAAAQRGATVTYFSLDMSPQMVTKRCLSILSGVDYDFITKGRTNGTGLFSERTSDDLLDAITKAGKELAGLPIYMNYVDNDITKMMAEVRLMSKTKKTPDLVFVDYIGLLSNKGKFGSRHHEIEDSTKKLLSLTKNEGMATVLLSQVNRGLQQGQRPTLDNIKESGAPGEACRNVFFIDRPGMYDKGKLPCETTLYAVKVSEGSPRDIHLHFNAPCYRFEEREHDDRCPFTVRS